MFKKNLSYFATFPQLLQRRRAADPERNVVLAGAKCGSGRERNVGVAGGNNPFNPFRPFNKMIDS